MALEAQTEAAISDLGGVLTGPELLKAIEQVGREPAIVECASGAGEIGRLWLQDGNLHDAQISWRSGAQALLHLFTWHDGKFRVLRGPHEHEDVMGQNAAVSVAAAAERGRQWRQTVAGLGGLDAIYEVNFATLATRLGEVPDSANNLLRLVDGQRCLRVLLDAAEVDELDAVGLIAQLAHIGIRS